MKHRTTPPFLFLVILCGLFLCPAMSVPLFAEDAQQEIFSPQETPQQAQQEAPMDTLAMLTGVWRPEADDPRCQMLPKLPQQIQCEDAYWSYFAILENDPQLMLDMDDCFIKAISTTNSCESHPNRFQWGWLDGCHFAELTMRDHCIERFASPVQAGTGATPGQDDQSER